MICTYPKPPCCRFSRKCEKASTPGASFPPSLAVSDPAEVAGEVDKRPQTTRYLPQGAKTWVKAGADEGPRQDRVQWTDSAKTCEDILGGGILEIKE